MKHPKKWYIPVTQENRAELQLWWQTKTEGTGWADLREGRILLSKHPEDSSYYWSASEESLTAWYPSYRKITLEQFRQITNTKPMKHPEKWCIPVTIENYEELNRWRLSKRTQEASRWDKQFVPGSTLLSEHPSDGSYFYANEPISLGDPSYQEITLEQFRQITNTNQTTMTKSIQISRDLLNAYYDAATTPQEKYLTEHFKLDGTTTEEAIRGLHDIACATWKPRIKKNHPDCFPEDSKHFDFSEHVRNSNMDKFIISADVCKSLGLGNDFIQVRSSGNPKLDLRSFYLSSDYNWELVQDGPAMVLIPTKKSC